jgi:hypothetical protein
MSEIQQLRHYINGRFIEGADGKHGLYEYSHSHVVYLQA